jgi:putative ABC transport system substrate-binding protein
MRGTVQVPTLGGRLSRRAFVGGLAGLGASATGLALVGGCDIVANRGPTAATVRRIGALLSNSLSTTHEWWDAFVDEFRTRGWLEGQNLTIEWRAADNQVDRLPDLAADLVRLKVELIVADGTPVALVAKQATSTIPIVFWSGGAVEYGLVDSLARPSGNATGVSTHTPSLFGKQVQLLKEVAPGLSRLAVMRDQSNDLGFRDVQGVAQSLGLQIVDVYVKVVTVDGVTSDFPLATDGGADGLLVMPSAAFVGPVEIRIAELAAQHRLPAAYPSRHHVEAGGLMSYSTNRQANFRRVATYVDRILRGARPGDLPVEQPADFEFTVNLKTAQALGLTIPPDVAAQVTEWVQ